MKYKSNFMLNLKFQNLLENIREGLIYRPLMSYFLHKNLHFFSYTLSLLILLCVDLSCNFIILFIREAGPVFDAGGLFCVLNFIRDSGTHIHKDTLHSAMAVVSR